MFYLLKDYLKVLPKRLTTYETGQAKPRTMGEGEEQWF